MTLMIALRGATALMLALAATLAPPARAGDDDDPPGAHCSTTATLLYRACGAETTDDYLVARAKCINVADARERSECVADAKDERSEAVQECTEQLAARRAVCQAVGEDRYAPAFDPDGFDADFRHLSNPNPYFPLGIGHRWEYRGGDERTAVEVLDATKRIEGVNCVVVRDLVYEDGKLKEATDDWFAAGRDGSTWYCGEESKDYEVFAGDRPKRAELVSIDGSFKHAREGDQAGIIMPARPRAGQVYREEFSLGNAEDVSQILTANYTYGENRALDRYVPRELAQRMCNRDCLVTKNASPLEPGAYELKYHARGIGVFLEINPDEGLGLQLVGCNFDQRCIALPTP